MEWILEPTEYSANACPRSACYADGTCNCRGVCASNTGVCAIKFGGVDCQKRNCGIYVG